MYVCTYHHQRRHKHCQDNSFRLMYKIFHNKGHHHQRHPHPIDYQSKKEIKSEFDLMVFRNQDQKLYVNLELLKKT